LKHKDSLIDTFEKLYKVLKPVPYKEAFEPAESIKPYTLHTSPFLALLSRRSRLEILDIEYSGKLDIRDLKNSDVDDLNFLQFLVLNLTVLSVKLSEPEMKKFKQKFIKRLNKVIEKINFPVTRSTTKKGTITRLFKLEELYEKLLKCFFTYEFHGPQFKHT
jgi:hypothetical protein